VGSVNIATTGLFTFVSSALTFNTGDILTVISPAVDATLAGITFTLPGTRL
jgi:hypothetical protein